MTKISLNQQAGQKLVLRLARAVILFLSFLLLLCGILYFIQDPLKMRGQNNKSGEVPITYADRILNQARQGDGKYERRSDSLPACANSGKPLSKNRTNKAMGKMPSEIVTDNAQPKAEESNRGKIEYRASTRQDQTGPERSLFAIESMGTCSSKAELEEIIGKDTPTERKNQEVFRNLQKIKVAVMPLREQAKPSCAEKQNINIECGERITERKPIDDWLEGLHPEIETEVRKKEEIMAALPNGIEEEELERAIHNKTGVRDINQVMAIIQAHSFSLQYCYERGRKENPHLKGKIVVRFSIAPLGKVIDAQILTSTLNNAEVEECILSHIKAWNDFGAIAPDQGNVVLRQTFTFGY